jgi:hypothetical protein
MRDEVISREDWNQHVDEDEQRGRDINDLKLAMFGDPEKPETVRAAVLPTMQRLNAHLDFIVLLGRSLLAVLAGFAALLGILKGLGLM